jgi:hypothetical protein
MLVIHSSSVTSEGENKNKKASTSVKTLYTSYKKCYAMTQEIKIILTFKEKEYLNIKSSEGNTCP